jgi:hypothetical protein
VKTTVHLPGPVAAGLETEAARRGQTHDQVAADLLAEHLPAGRAPHGPRRPRPKDLDPKWSPWRPDVDSFARLIAWGGFTADQFVHPPKQAQAGGFITNLPTYLRSDPNLDERGVRALETIIRAAYDQFRQQD